MDITHGIQRYAVRQGALVLRNTLPVHAERACTWRWWTRRWAPSGARSRCGRGDGRILVGPDNGLLSLAWERCGGVDQAVDITRSPHRLEPVSATFHGRDIFAPVAAHLAGRRRARRRGRPDRARARSTVELPDPRVEDGALVAHALVIDHFGNVGLNVGSRAPRRHRHSRSAARVDVEAGGERYLATYAQTFADVEPGELIVYEDAYRTLALAINRGDAAGTLGLGVDAEVRLRPG